MLETVQTREENNGDDKWFPQIIKDVYDGCDYGFEVVIVKKERMANTLREKVLKFINPRPKPIIISETGISLSTAIEGAKGLRTSPWGIGIENGGYNICVRTTYPLRLLRQIIDNL